MVIMQNTLHITFVLMESRRLISINPIEIIISDAIIDQSAKLLRGVKRIFSSTICIEYAKEIIANNSAKKTIQNEMFCSIRNCINNINTSNTIIIGIGI